MYRSRLMADQSRRSDPKFLSGSTVPILQYDEALASFTGSRGLRVTADLSQSSTSQADTGCRSLQQALLHARPFSRIPQGRRSSVGAAKSLYAVNLDSSYACTPSDASDLTRSSTSLPDTGCRPQRWGRLPIHPPSHQRTVSKNSISGLERNMLTAE